MIRANTAATLLALAVFLSACGAPKDTAAPPAAPADPVAAGVEQFIDSYFEVWSANDMDGYGAKFDDEAVIQFVAEGGRTATWNRAGFLETQVDAHKHSPAPMREFPLSKRVSVSPNERAAQASVRWKLVAGDRQDIGWNHFTLLRRPDGWRILHLVFYKE